MKAFATVLFLFAVVGHVEVLGDKKKHFNEFVQWVNENGGSASDKLKLKLVDKSGFATRSLIAKEAIEPKTTVFGIPRDLWLTQKSHSYLDKTVVFDCPLMTEKGRKAVPTFVRAVGFALEVKKGENSFWYPWIRLLPTLSEFYYSWPPYASNETKAKFPKLPLFGNIDSLFVPLFGIMENCTRNFPEEHGLNQLTTADLRYAWAVVSTRSVTVQDQERAFVPGLDFLNYDFPTDLTANVKIIEDPVRKAWEATTTTTTIDKYIQSTPAPVLDFGIATAHETKEITKGTELTMDTLLSIGASLGELLHNQDLVFLYGYYQENNPVLGSKTVASGIPKRKESIDSMELRQNMFEMLEPAKKNEVPRCKMSTLKQRQGGILCTVARLTYEIHRVDWGLFEDEPKHFLDEQKNEL